MTMIRYANKVVSLDGGTTIELPLDLYEFQDGGGLRNAESFNHGRDFAYDHLRDGISPRDLGRSTVRFGVGLATPILTDAFIDQLRSTLLAMGPFWLYTLGADGSERRARCRLSQMPDLLVTYKTSITTLAALDMRRYTDWRATTPTTWSQVVTATPTSWTVNNPGGLPVDDAVIRLRANASNFFNNPLLENLTTGYEARSGRDASNAAHELKYDFGQNSVGWSTNDGVSYADDIANMTFSALHLPLGWEDAVGNNSYRYTNNGTPGLTIEGSFYARWA